MHRSVRFRSGNWQLAGDLYLPDDDTGRYPGVVLCHGFTGVKERFFPRLGAELASAGFAALAFDYQCRGESEGTPRGDMDPHALVGNVRDAISCLRTLPQVGPCPVGLFGVSFGGATALQAAILDRRVAAVVVAGPVTDAGRWLRGLRHPHDWNVLLDRIDADRERRYAGAESETIPAYELMVPDPDSAEHFREITSKEAPRMSMSTNLSSAEALIHFSPERNVDRVSPRALLFIASPNDVIVPAEEAISAYQSARPPKELVLLPADVSHWGVYEHPLVLESAVAWYRRYLPPATAAENQAASETRTCLVGKLNL